MRGDISLAVAVVAALTAVPGAAQPAGHLLQDPNDHVVLVPTTPGLSMCAFRRVLPDGTKEAPDFQVPAGRFLVVTDVEWLVSKYFVTLGSPNFPLKANRQVVAELLTRPAGQRGALNLVFQSRGVTVPMDGEIAAGSEHLTGGVTVAAGATLCLVGRTNSHSDFAVFTQAVLRGYLVDAL
jgi:hypothetical protein